jgi:hypothetical protein
VSPNATEYDQYDPSKGAIDRQLGLLVNAVGDFKAAKDAGRPLFRVIGGDGLLVLICEPTPPRVVVQRLIVAAGLLSEKKFKSQARDVLARDQNAPVTDPSKWPEMAFAARRLALDTTEKNANKVVDEFFASAPSQKYPVPRLGLSADQRHQTPRQRNLFVGRYLRPKYRISAHQGSSPN